MRVRRLGRGLFVVRHSVQDVAMQRVLCNYFFAIDSFATHPLQTRASTVVLGWGNGRHRRIRSSPPARSPTSCRRSPRSGTSTTGRPSNAGSRSSWPRSTRSRRRPTRRPSRTRCSRWRRCGQTLQRVAEVFFNKSSSDSTDFTNALEEEIAPRLAAHEDAIRLDPALYARIADLHDAARRPRAWTPESRYLVERYHAEFTLAGAGLSDDDKDTLRDYNQRLSTLTTRFEKNLLADTNELAVVFDDAAELDGSARASSRRRREAARERGLDGKFVVTLVLPTGHPFLAGLTSREAARADHDRVALRAASAAATNDNRDLVLEITRLRAERAACSASRPTPRTSPPTRRREPPRPSPTCSAASRPAAARNARAEQADLQEQLRRSAVSTPSASWDWATSPRRCGSEKYDVDVAAMRPYFEAERVLRDGVFFAANRLYGITFAERPDLVAYHPEARVFEVAQRGRLRARPLHPRPLHPRLEARRRVDESAHLAVRPARQPDRRGQQPQRAEARAPASRPSSPTTRPTRSSTSSGTRCTACSPA